MASAGKLDFLDWVDQYNVNRSDIASAATNPIIHFVKQGKTIRGTYMGLPVYRDKSFETDIKDGETWVCTLKRYDGDTSKCYFATPVRLIDADFFFSLNESNQEVIADYLFKYHRAEIEQSIGEIEGKKIFKNDDLIDYDRQIKAKDAEIAKLNRTIESQKADMEKMKESKEETSSKTKELKENVKNLQKSLDDANKDLENTKTELRNSKTRFETETELLNEKIERIEEENAKMKAAREAIEATRLKKEGDEKAAIIENKQLKAKVKSLEASVKEMSSTIYTSEEDSKQLKEAIKFLEGEVLKRDNQINELSSQTVPKESGSKASEKELKEKDQRISELESRIKELESEPRSTVQNSKFSTIIDAYTEQLELFEKENQGLKDAITASESQIKEAQAKAEEYSKELAKAKESVNALTKANEELKAVNAVLMDSEPSVSAADPSVSISWETTKKFTSDWFAPGSYKVFVNPNTKSIRFLKHERGTITAENNTILLSGLDEIALFTGKKVLSGTTDENGGVTVVLG